jgi:hypothetical protein
MPNNLRCFALDKRPKSLASTYYYLQKEFAFYAHSKNYFHRVTDTLALVEWFVVNPITGKWYIRKVFAWRY